MDNSAMLRFKDRLPPEIEEGNIEYKLKLIKPSKTRLEHLVTQMNWRLREGNGEAIYELGVEDQGYFAGLSRDDMEESKTTLAAMAHELGATLQILREKVVSAATSKIDCEGHNESVIHAINNGSPESELSSAEEKYVCEVLVRKVSDDQPFIDLRVAVLGNHGSGKSTLIGVLTRGEHDDGQGRARLNLLRHAHEIESGRTSCISIDVLGYDGAGQTVNYAGRRTVEEIYENSSKLITFLDLAGFHKYQKTTMFGLTSYAPDFVMLVVDSTCGLVGTSKEHLGFAIALNLPLFIVVTKVDVGLTTQTRPSSLDRTLEHLEMVLTSLECVKVPFRVRSKDQAITAAFNLSKGNIVPILTVSCVDGTNLDLLHNFLQVLPPLIPLRDGLATGKIGTGDHEDSPEFQIDETFTIEGVDGVVVSGIMSQGTAYEGASYLVGPFDDGHFKGATIKSIHRCRMIRKCIRAGDCATLALSLDHSDTSKLRKGMVLLDPVTEPRACATFTADIHVLFHATSITQGFQTTVHVRNVRQTAIIERLSKPSLRTGQSGSATFRFLKHPVYLRLGSKLIIREGSTRGIGHVSAIEIPVPACLVVGNGHVVDQAGSTRQSPSHVIKSRVKRKKARRLSANEPITPTLNHEDCSDFFGASEGSS